MNSFNELLDDYYANAGNIRLGQYFCNQYIKKQWPTLFYADFDKACSLITNWLRDNNYIDELPPKI